MVLAAGAVALGRIVQRVFGVVTSREEFVGDALVAETLVA